jgi:hypothetical protein
MKRSLLAIGLLAAGLYSSAVNAKLEYIADKTDDGLRFIVISGRFDPTDDLSAFEELIARHRPEVLSFNSLGGNPYKAMELGRIIRAHRMTVLQPRELDCASSCALAFMGGSVRVAAPGSLGFHQTSFSSNYDGDVETAVAAVQKATGDVVAYMQEMGVDPALLQFSLNTAPNDLRYLSGQEMETYRLTTSGKAASKVPSEQDQRERSLPARSAPAKDSPPPMANLGIPVARSGMVRHPDGLVSLKASPSGKANDITSLSNGSRVDIVSSSDRWYAVRSSAGFGYLHHTWVRVDQFDATPGYLRLIQIKSFSELSDAREFARQFPLSLSVYLATNGWYAVTLAKQFPRAVALELTRELKKDGAIPSDSFVTLGNTYVKRVCCN